MTFRPRWYKRFHLFLSCLLIIIFNNMASVVPLTGMATRQQVHITSFLIVLQLMVFLLVCFSTSSKCYTILNLLEFMASVVSLTGMATRQPMCYRKTTCFMR